MATTKSKRASGYDQASAILFPLYRLFHGLQTGDIFSCQNVEAGRRPRLTYNTVFCCECTIVDLDVTAETKCSCFQEIKEATPPPLTPDW